MQNPPDWEEILTYFRGSELQNYFTRMLEDKLKVLYCHSFAHCVFVLAIVAHRGELTLLPAARTLVSSMSVARRETPLLQGQPPNGP